MSNEEIAKVKHLLQVLLEAGFEIMVDDGTIATTKKTDSEEILRNLNSTGFDRLHCVHHSRRNSWVDLVWGQGSEELIADYGQSLGDLLDPIS